MIQSHLYTNQPETPLYTEMGGQTEAIGVLGQGNWVGVLERHDEWCHVITIQGDGWVNINNLEERSPFNLHVHWEPGKPIEYVSAA